jgi:oxygen-independent coproporphyrinogen-3 oxidase
MRAFEVARVTFPRVSFDLIYARQGQTPDAWRWELGRALAMAVDHLSLYQLTIEPGTRFGDLAARGRLRGLPAAEAAAEMFLATQEACGMAGLAGYETSNHARPGAEGRHNLVYWRYGDYAGIGPGAHGRLSHGDDRLATVAHRAPEAWLEAVETLGSGLAEETFVPPADQAAEMLMMGLRLTEGVDPRRYARLAGAPLDPERLRHLARLGMLTTCDDRIAATNRGRGLLDALLKILLFQ